MAIASTIAGADGVADKGYDPETLFAMLRSVARGDRTLPRVRPDALSALARKLDPDDMPIFGMLMAQTPVGEIATTLSLDRGDLDSRITGMLARRQRGMRQPNVAP